MEIGMSGSRELLDLFSVHDVFVTALGSVEQVGGGNWRFTFVAMQEVQGRQELVVTAKIIMPGEALPRRPTAHRRSAHRSVRLSQREACRPQLGGGNG